MLFVRFGARAQTLERLRLRMLHLTTGWEQEKVKRIVAETLIQVVGPITYKEAVDLIAGHKQAGRRVYIVSAAPEEIVEPLARYLGAEEAIASRAAVSAGLYTGQLLNYAYGPQKAATIRLIAERDGLDLNESWAYSDSVTDLPMLETVGHPVVVNPDRALRRIAQMRGWPVLQFSELMARNPHCPPSCTRQPVRRRRRRRAGRPGLGRAHRDPTAPDAGRCRLRRRDPSHLTGAAGRSLGHRPERHRMRSVQAARSFLAAMNPTPTIRASTINFLSMTDTVAGGGR